MPVLDKKTLGRMAGGLLPARMEQALAARDAALYGEDAYRPAAGKGRAVPGELSARICGAAGCTGSWAKPWRRRRPVFEEEWGCSGRCLQTMVRAAVRREVGEGAPVDTALPHRHRVPLGLVLLAQGWITHPQLQTALEAQRASGRGRIGDWLMEGCGLEEERITRGLGMQWSCPVLTTEGFEPGRMALVMPRRFVTEYGLLPLRVAGSSLLYLASASRMDAPLALAVEQMSGLTVESGLLNARQMDEARDRLMAAPAVPEQMAAVADADALSAQMTRVLEQRQPVASRLVRVRGYYWLRLWLESAALSGVGRLPASAEDVQDYLFTIGGGVQES